MSDFYKLIADLPQEQQAIRSKCFHPAGTFVEFKKEEVEKSIPERFEKIVRDYPDRIAVKAGEQLLTFDALNNRANRIARAIYDERGAQSEPMVLISQHPLNGVASCFGILKAGKILIVVDPSFPFERVAAMIENSAGGAIVTDSSNLAFAKALARNERQVMNIDALDCNPSEINLGLRISPDAPAQIVYSSGSTGEPKGIFFNHRRILHDVMAEINGAHFCPDDRIIQFRKLSFGAGIRVAFWALLSGAAMVHYDINTEGLTKLAGFLNEAKITIFPPGVPIFRHFVGGLSGVETFPSIRLVTLGCDAISHGDIEAYKKIFPDDCLLLHHMSSSEAGLISRYFITKKTELNSAILPVGYPPEGKEVFLLDETGKTLDRDQVGEIAVRSRYLSSGYWRNDDLTNAKFLADPAGGDERIYLTGDLGRMLPSGCLFYLGRKDFVVRIRGYTVEMGEIERALLGDPGVKEAGVIAWDQEAGEKYLAAYIVPRGSPAPTIDELRSFLKNKLPDYMIPSAFVFLDALPLTNGKLDRKALQKPGSNRPEVNQPYMSPRSDVERKMAQIWEGVFDLRSIGICDSFFDLGGHSLMATRIFAKVAETFGVELTMRHILDAPTVAGLAGIVATLSGSKNHAEQVLSESTRGDESGEI
jgi:acyl-coenzyme A synthetase/AMP-(fatty) acid ligase/acyl carrier protein